MMPTRAERIPLTHPLDDAAATFTGLRRRFFGIAYRMLGSAAEAEDIVQEVWLRWQATDRSLVRDPAAFLATMTTRLAINNAQSARSRRETYVGQWLPEPVDTSADPELGAERGEALELGVLRLLEMLTPAERAVYVLSEAFDYPYAQIAEVLHVKEANARQLASRARKHLSGERREHISAVEHRSLLDTFLTAARTGDLPALEHLFAEDVASYSDGGGVVAAASSSLLAPRRFLSSPAAPTYELLVRLHSADFALHDHTVGLERIPCRAAQHGASLDVELRAVIRARHR